VIELIENIINTGKIEEDSYVIVVAHVNFISNQFLPTSRTSLSTQPPHPQPQPQTQSTSQ
jgi:hypothetical protein